LQHDNRQLWVAAAHDGAVTALETAGLAVVARITLGLGAHRLAISGDDRRLIVTNQDDASVSVIDTGKLATLATLSVGVAPRALAVSALANLVYVAVADSVAIIDPASATLAGRIDGIAEATAIAISPDGRWGFAASPTRNRVSIFDTATNRLMQSLNIEDAPFEIAFTESEAYIRRRDNETVTLVPLAPLRLDGGVAGRAEFPAGEKPVAATMQDTLAASMASSQGEAAMLLASPAERAIHYYHEGMAAPADSFDDLGRQPVAIAIADHSLRQKEPGIYSAVARLPRPGVYDFVVLLDSPRIAHCFVLDAAATGATVAMPTLVPVTLPRSVPAGKPVSLEFRFTRPPSSPEFKEPAAMAALAILAPGSWFERVPMSRAEDGIWRLEFTPPRAGAYLLSIETLGLASGSGQNFTMDATEPGTTEAQHE
jgi:YVTN family beta-propeller protein